MEAGELIKRDLILDNLNVSSKEEALRKMAEILYNKGYVEKDFIKAILEREKHYPSGLPMEGHKIAIPHTDATYVKKSAILFARLNNYVDFNVMGSPEETIKVKMISMFALKEKKKIGDLLETLITLYQDNNVLDNILMAKDGDEIYRILKKGIESSL